MNTKKYDISDPKLKQNFINLRLAGFNLSEISAAIDVSYTTARRIYDELKPEIKAQIVKKKCFDNSSLTNRIDKFLLSLEKHFFFIEEGMVDACFSMNFEQYVSSMLKFSSAYEKLVKLRVLLASSKNQQDFLQPDIQENVTQTIPQEPDTSVIADSDENVPLQSPVTVNECNSSISNEHSEQENYSIEITDENVHKQSNLADSNEHSEQENSSNEIVEKDENVPQNLSQELGTSLNKENISYFKYRKLKLSKNVKLE